MIMMLNVHEFNIAHPERLGNTSICPKYVYDVHFGSVVDQCSNEAYLNLSESLCRKLPVVAVSLVRLQAECRITDPYYKYYPRSSIVCQVD